MLEMSQKDVQIYVNNLLRRKKSFVIEKKRREQNVIVNGKKVAKVKNQNTMGSVNKDESKSILNLFASVKKSVNRYLVKNNFQVKEVPKKYSSVYSNRELFDEMPVGSQFYYIDVKHCYWRIAFLKGYITEYYYNKILEKPDLKLYRNMALSCIVAPKEVTYYVDGEKSHTIIEDNTLYDIVYKNIRHSAWNLFGRLAFDKVGKENCLGYFTDGIMVFPADLKKVKTVLARHQLQHRVIECEKTNHREYVYVEDGSVKNF